MRAVPKAVLVAALAVAAPALSAEAAELALKRVLLSTGGVGYFEFEAEVDGSEELALPVRRDVVDDVLMSLVVYDDKGRVGRVSLPGAESEQALFRDLPFPREALADPVALLNALRGAELIVGGPQPLRGRIVGVTRDGKDGRHRVSLMTATGIRQAVMEEADELRFADAKLQAQIERALAGLVELGRRETRVLRVAVAGEGKRRVRVAYVAGTPLWKATYRLTLPAEAGAKSAALQGWAVVENESGEDWRDVELTLVSGNPVTFRQALYAPYYVARPQVPVEVWGRTLPPRGDVGSAPLLQQLAAANAPMPASPSQVGAARSQNERMRQEFAKASDALRENGTPAEAQLLAAEIGEAQTQVSFRAPGAITVATGHSLVVPLIAKDLPAERVALFQPATQARNPLASVRIVNVGAAALPPGVVTLYERAADGGGVTFLGDARLNPVPAGESRLLSYAVDFKTRIDFEVGRVSRLTRARIADGLLHAITTERQTTTWTVTTAPGEGRKLVVELPKPGPEWTIVEPAEGVERAGASLRLGREIAAGQTVKLALGAERPVEERVDLNTLRGDQLSAFLRSNVLSAKQQEALRRLGALAQAQAEGKRAVGAAEAELKRLVDDQRRVRDNISYVQGEQQKTYREKLAQLEERIVKAQTANDAARETAERAERALAEFVRTIEA